LADTLGTDKAPGQYIVATVRAPSDTGTLWVGLRRGRVFISSNADKASGTVIFYRIDTSSTPTRFVSGITVDPSDPNHAFISFSGYNAYATASGTATGDVFDVHYDPNGHTATGRISTIISATCRSPASPSTRTQAIYSSRPTSAWTRCRRAEARGFRLELACRPWRPTG
jgi:hypothetical protein